jgi:hypothetical protein
MEYLLWQEVLFLGVAGKTGPGCSFVHASWIYCWCEVVKAGVWLREFLASLKVMESASQPVTIFYDNTTSIKVFKYPKFHTE